MQKKENTCSILLVRHIVRCADNTERKAWMRWRSGRRDVTRRSASLAHSPSITVWLFSLIVYASLSMALHPYAWPNTCANTRCVFPYLWRIYIHFLSSDMHPLTGFFSRGSTSVVTYQTFLYFFLMENKFKPAPGLKARSHYQMAQWSSAVSPCEIGSSAASYFQWKVAEACSKFCYIHIHTQD